MDIHFNAQKIKYDTLNRLVNPITRSMSVNSVNIFINLDDIFHRLHRPIVNAEFQIAGNNASKQMISNVLNLIAHYKQWGVRQGWKTKVFAIYTSAYNSHFKNELYIKTYRHKFKTSFNDTNADYFAINNAIKQSEEMFLVLSQYIEDVYIIDSKFLEPSILPLYISNEIYKSDYDIIISKDLYDLQYATYDRWLYLNPKGEKSYIVNKNNIWRYIADIEKINKSEYKLDYSTKIYPLLLGIVGQGYRNIPKLRTLGWRTLFKILDELTVDVINDISLRISLFETIRNKKLNIDSINNSISVIDIIEQVSRIGEMEKAFISHQLKDVPDYENLLSLNNRHFAKYPINIPFLADQNLSKSRKNSFGL